MHYDRCVTYYLLNNTNFPVPLTTFLVVTMANSWNHKLIWKSKSRSKIIHNNLCWNVFIILGVLRTLDQKRIRKNHNVFYKNTDTSQTSNILFNTHDDRIQCILILILMETMIWITLTYLLFGRWIESFLSFHDVCLKMPWFNLHRGIYL